MKGLKGALLLLSILWSVPLWALEIDLKKLQRTFYKNVTRSTICPDKKSCYQLKNKDKLFKRIQTIYISLPYWNALKSKAASYRHLLNHSQFVTVIDLSRQLLVVALWDAQTEQFHFIGSDIISSGNMELEATVDNGDDHYLKTPTGVFKLQSGWRSDGKTLDDNITLPYGQKDRFIYYFGTQKSIRYNTFDRNGTKLNDKKDWQLIEDELEFAIHAHKSSKSLGKPYSHGCIRMSHELNTFLDRHLVLHKGAFNAQKKWSMKWIDPPRYDINVSLAGEYLFVFDTLKD